MSHDVKAIHPTFDRKPADALLSDYHYQSDEWERIYDWMIKSAYPASISRSAGNPLNQVIYLALGVMDPAYAGESGNGQTIAFNREELMAAQHFVNHRLVDGLKRPLNGVDDLIDKLTAGGATMLDCSLQGDTMPERKFLADCLQFMDTNELESLQIQFA